MTAEQPRDQGDLLAPDQWPRIAGFPYGGERDPNGWERSMVGPDGLSPSSKFAIDFYQNFVFSDPHWDYRDYDFANWKQDITKVSAMLDATSTDLSFKKREGKIYSGQDGPIT